MQTRVSCPACQTTLAVNIAQGDSALLRCPKCRHEFAIRLRSPLPDAPMGRPPNSPLSAPASVRPPLPSYDPAADQPPEAETAPGNALLWIGICAGMALALVGLVAILTLRVAGGNDPQNAGQNPVAEAPISPPGPSSVPPSADGSVSPVTSTTAAPPMSPTGAGGALLAYRFNRGEEYIYAFTVKAEVGGRTDETGGICSLVLSREGAPAAFAKHEKSGQGNGSGFVITPDGYVVTCAHVVEGSTAIDVILDKQTYPGRVVAFDKEHDLAVLRVVAANLPTVSLANSDTVQLAEEVRAVGFPLSTVLGESVKITRGTIAGVVDNAGSKLFQVDASINPGNSGGPLVNEMGQVVGVASAKLAGQGIDGVGFAVPANEVLSLLQRKMITLSVAAPRRKLDGPALARQVTPAVAMIKVTIGPGGYGTANRLLVDFSGHMSSAAPSQAVGNPRLPGGSSTRAETGRLLVSEHGELVDATASSPLPYLLGPLGTFAIEPLGSGDERAWQTRHAAALMVGQEAQSSDSPRVRRRLRGPFEPSAFGQGSRGQPQNRVVTTPAIETSSYELTGTNGGLATIAKRYTFQTLDPPGSPPTAKVAGGGTMTFNCANGYAEKMDYKATLTRNVGGTTVTIPVTLEWRRLSPSELGSWRDRSPAAQLVGEDTRFVGGPRGRSQRTAEDSAVLYGVDCTLAKWSGEQCVGEITPIFSRDQQPLSGGEVARDGYAVGAVEIHAQTYVNAIRLIFMRVVGDRRLDPADSYTGQWIGTPGAGPPQTLTGDGAPIIGFHLRRGAVVDAMALVIDRQAK